MAICTSIRTNNRTTDERHWLLRSLAALQSVTGEHSAGWRAPLYRFSHRSAELLLEAEVLYDASLMGDDVPYLIDTPRGALLELPSHWGMDDWPPFMHSSELELRDADSIGRASLGGLVGGVRGHVGIRRLVDSRLASVSIRPPCALAPYPPDDRQNARSRPGMVRDPCAKSPPMCAAACRGLHAAHGTCRSPSARTDAQDTRP